MCLAKQWENLVYLPIISFLAAPLDSVWEKKGNIDLSWTYIDGDQNWNNLKVKGMKEN